MAGCRPPVVGPLGQFVDGFLVELAELGSSQRSWEAQLRLLRLLSIFLASRTLETGDLTSKVLGGFIEDRQRSGTKMRSKRALSPLLGYLRRLGVVPEAKATTPTEPTLVAFSRYLRTERGLASTTVAGYVSQVRPFLGAFPDRSAWGSLTSRTVSAFVLRRAGRVSARSMQVEAKAVRALLRWVWVEGMVSAPLADAVGPFAAARGTRPPKALTASEVDNLRRAVAAGPDRLRNEAMVALMLRLGLRAGEVVALCLQDIDWRGGVVRIRGNGAHLDALPLPVDVGQVRGTYLAEGRPNAVSHRQVFLRSPAPHAPLSVQAVSLMVSAALHRGGTTGPGAAHRLRHTAACGVLATGGGLIEAGQLLRHSGLSATAIYAKADLPALRAVARPWPTLEQGR